MARREPDPDDYESNQDYAYDAGFDVDLDDPERTYYDCSMCLSGHHDDCQRQAVVLCKCFLNDHMEAF